MSIEVACDDCGERLRVEETERGSKTSCPHCGGVVQVPAAFAPRKKAAPKAAARAAEEDEVEELDAACPRCDAPMSADAVLCVACGYNARTGKRLTTVVKRFKRHWESEMSLPVRAVMCGAAVVAGLLLFALLAIKVHPSLLLLMLPWTIAAIFFCGDFSSTDVERTRKGKLLVTGRSYICFLPIGAKTVDAAHCNALILDYSAHINYAMIVVVILLCLTAPPVALLRLPMLLARSQGQRGTCRLSLRGIHHRDDLLIYKGANQNKVREIIDSIQEAANLTLERR